MKVSGTSRYALCASMSIAVLAGCGGSQPPIGEPGAMLGLRGGSGASPAGEAARNFAVLFSFDQTDGSDPLGGLLDVNGTLYGTTWYGGANACSGAGCGTVFSISPTGKQKVLHNFGGNPDGYFPNAGLIDVKGTFYGTTYGGGSSSHGTVFSITTAGKEKVLYSFAGSPDGSTPSGGLLNVKGKLYGATAAGGNKTCSNSGYYACGVVYSVTTTGAEKVLYRFTGPPDGANPQAPLIDVKGTLYGTTFFGGSAGSNCYNSQCGTVFSVTTSGKEAVLHSFAGPPDGEGPNGGLLNVSGILYGTTFSGGDAPCGMTNAEGCGVVFNITTAGKETVLYRFGATPDAACADAGLLNVSGTLYGTTHYGGRHGYGTVYSVTTAGTEAVLHSFARRANGPSQGGLLDVKNSLYGTTSGGDGRYGFGYGTLFTLKL